MCVLVAVEPVDFRKGIDEAAIAADTASPKVTRTPLIRLRYCKASQSGHEANTYGYRTRSSRRAARINSSAAA